jgi:hypothetical protein
MKQQSSYEYLWNLFLSQELLMYLEHFTEDSIDAYNLTLQLSLCYFQFQSRFSNPFLNYVEKLLSLRNPIVISVFCQFFLSSLSALTIENPFVGFVTSNIIDLLLQSDEMFRYLIV